MGQRLNVEIWNNGKVLANAYYHWSAYTSAAAEIIDKALAAAKIFSMSENEVLYAVRLLESTGAGLTESEREHICEQLALKDYDFKECMGRNSGLIAVTDEGIRETRYWEEGVARIYVDEKRISFRVFCSQPSWEWKRERMEDYGEADADPADLQVVDFNLDDIKFDDWGVAHAFLRKIEEPFKTRMNYHYVITPIW